MSPSTVITHYPAHAPRIVQNQEGGEVQLTTMGSVSRGVFRCMRDRWIFSLDLMCAVFWVPQTILRINVNDCSRFSVVLARVLLASFDLGGGPNDNQRSVLRHLSNPRIILGYRMGQSVFTEARTNVVPFLVTMFDESRCMLVVVKLGQLLHILVIVLPGQWWLTASCSLLLVA